MEDDWELLDGEDLVEGEGELLVHKLPEGKIRSHPPSPHPSKLKH